MPPTKTSTSTFHHMILRFSLLNCVIIHQAFVIQTRCSPKIKTYFLNKNTKTRWWPNSIFTTSLINSFLSFIYFDFIIIINENDFFCIQCLYFYLLFKIDKEIDINIKNSFIIFCQCKIKYFLRFLTKNILEEVCK